MKQEQLPADDETIEVAPGVVRVQLPILLPGLGHVNCYVLDDQRGATIIDPGLPGPESYKELIIRLGRAGYPPERVHSVIVTHSHPDHFGGAGRLHAEFGSRVVTHASFSTPFDHGWASLDADLVTLDDDPGTSQMPDVSRLSRIQQEFHEALYGAGPIPDLPAQPTPWGEDGFRLTPEEIEHIRTWDDYSKRGLLSLDPTDRVIDADTLQIGRSEWTVVHTPGHTGDHICLFDPTHGTLISGDHVLPTITPHISGIGPSPDSLDDYFGGLRTVAAIPGVETVLPAHGLPFSDLAGRVTQIVEHHVDRLDQLLDFAHEFQDADVRTFARRLFKEQSWGTMAESETYAHLEHLRAKNLLTRSTDESGRVRYQPIPEDQEP